jgi:hypothetical protein
MIKLVTLLLSATGAVAVPRHPDAPILDLPDDDNIAGSSSSLLADFTRRTKLTLQSPEEVARIILAAAGLKAGADYADIRITTDIDPATGQQLKDGEPVVDADGKPVMYDKGDKDVRAMSTLGAKGEPGLQHTSAFNSRHRDEASLSTIHGHDKRFDPTTPEDDDQVRDLKLDDELGGEIRVDLHYPAQRAVNKADSEREDEPTDEEFIDYYYSAFDPSSDSQEHEPVERWEENDSTWYPEDNALVPGYADDTTMPSVGLEYKSQQHQLDEESEGEVREEDWVDLDTDYNDEEQAEVDVETYSSGTVDDYVASINQPTWTRTPQLKLRIRTLALPSLCRLLCRLKKTPAQPGQVCCMIRP